MKVELVTPEVEQDVRITMSRSEAQLLRYHMGETALSDWLDLAARHGFEMSVGTAVNQLYYKLGGVVA